MLASTVKPAGGNPLSTFSTVWLCVCVRARQSCRIKIKKSHECIDLEICADIRFSQRFFSFALPPASQMPAPRPPLAPAHPCPPYPSCHHFNYSPHPSPLYPSHHHTHLCDPLYSCSLIPISLSPSPYHPHRPYDSHCTCQNCHPCHLHPSYCPYQFCHPYHTYHYDHPYHHYQRFLCCPYHLRRPCLLPHRSLYPDDPLIRIIPTNHHQPHEDKHICNSDVTITNQHFTIDMLHIVISPMMYKYRYPSHDCCQSFGSSLV